MREILFRGKAIDGNWYYGVPLVFADDYICITASHTYNKSVIPETVGQYTGLTDKNGNKIFEGDIVDYDYFGERKIGKVFFNGCGYEIENEGCFLCAQYADKQLDCEVIGNIHDNPEILKGGEG
jgi:uncharacterized phage protein (TIGR01671 family)